MPSRPPRPLEPAAHEHYLQDYVLKQALETLFQKRSLSEAQAAAVFELMLSGEMNTAVMAAIHTAMKLGGETLEEIMGAVTVMRGHMVKLTAPVGTIDCCGTGGDARGTLNISTAVSFVLAGAGVSVAKHGNRSVSSKSGAADVLEALGVDVNIAPEQAQHCLDRHGITFLMAPRYHPALHHVMPVRKALGTRTIFNLLGPLCNPAQVQYQLVGVSAPHLTEVFAHVLRRGGSRRACVVYGADGLDELSLTGVNHLTWLDETGKIHSQTLRPEDIGLARCTLGDLVGGTAEYNALVLRELLEGTHKGPYRNCVLLNAAVALMVVGKVSTLQAGLAHGAHSLDSGAALGKLEALIEETQTVYLETEE